MTQRSQILGFSFRQSWYLDPCGNRRLDQCESWSARPCPPTDPLLTPVLPVDLDPLISEATAAHWAGSRGHVLGPIERAGKPLHAP